MLRFNPSLFFYALIVNMLLSYPIYAAEAASGEHTLPDNVNNEKPNTGKEEKSWKDDLPKPLRGEGPFVEYPTVGGMEIGAISGVIVGVPPAAVAGIIGGVVDIAVLISSGGQHRTNLSFGLGEPVHGVFARGGMYLGAYAIGGPFYLIKKLFYDLPRALLLWGSETEASG